MTAVEIVALVVGGALGAGARYVVDGLIMRGRTGVFPLGILVVNIVGSFLLGVLTGLPGLPHAWLMIGGTGVLGGFTTLSTVMVETILLAQRRRRDWAWMNLLGTFVVCLIAAALGVLIGGLFPR